jgi:hypothetical protein
MTQKFGRADLRFFCKAHLLNEIYLSTKLLVDTSCDFRGMSRTKLKNEQKAITPKLG